MRLRMLAWALPVVTVLAVVGLWPSASSLGRYWLANEDYNYGVLIALVSLIWLWRSQVAIATSLIKPALWLSPVLCLVLLAWYVLWQGNSEMGAQLLMPIVIWLAIAVVLGWPAAKLLLMPVGYLYFAIPWWDQLFPLLQQLTIFGVRTSMQLASIPVTVSGNLISIKEGTFEVLYGCSGLRYLVVSLASASLLGGLAGMRKTRLLAFAGLTAWLAIMANWVRIFIVMYMGHITGMKHYFITDSHRGLGNIVFVVLLVLVLWLAKLFMQRRNPVTAYSIDLPMSSGDGYAATRHALLLVGSLFTIFICLSVRAIARSPEVRVPQLLSVPIATGTWQGPYPTVSAWQPYYEFAADARRFSYVVNPTTNAPGDANQVEVYLNVYGEQQQGRELVFFRNTPYAPGHWKHVGDMSIGGRLSALLGHSPALTEQLNEDGERWLVGHIYVVSGWRSASDFLAQAWYGASTLTNPAPAGVVAIAARCGVNCDAAQALLHGFWNEVGESLVAAIPKRIHVAL